MGFFDGSKNNKKKSNLPTQGVLCIRIVVACYLLYLSYDLFKTREASTMSPVALYLILGLFVVCSVYIIIDTIFIYIKGMYFGGKGDTEDLLSDEDTEEEPKEEPLIEEASKEDAPKEDVPKEDAPEENEVKED